MKPSNSAGCSTHLELQIYFGCYSTHRIFDIPYGWTFSIINSGAFWFDFVDLYGLQTETKFEIFRLKVYFLGLRHRRNIILWKFGRKIWETSVNFWKCQENFSNGSTFQQINLPKNVLCTIIQRDVYIFSTRKALSCIVFVLLQSKLSDKNDF